MPAAALAAVCSLAIGASSWAQNDRRVDAPAQSLQVVAADLNARLVRIERAQGVLFGALASGRALDESEVVRRVIARVSGQRPGDRDPEADEGFAALGSRVSGLVRHAHEFHREVASILAGVPPEGRRRALDAAVDTYRRRPDVALPDAPKDMTILYDHPYTSFVPPVPPETEPRREHQYPRLIGLLWATHWYELAVLEPLQDLDDRRAREQGLSIVARRFEQKLSESAPPDAFPTELPLAPAIAPGLVALHERAAAIIDNLDIMMDVIADVLVHRDVTNRQSEIDRIATQFMDRHYRCVQTDEWIVVALRHSIFDQGGFALKPMAGYERNAFFGGHGQHYAVRRAPPPCDAEAGAR
jgi:hypothetical protein